MNAHSDIPHRLAEVQQRVASVALSARRSPQDIRLIVVTKSHPLQAVQEVIAAGATDLGENYVDEGVSKIKANVQFPDLSWHMIGHVQSRKAQEVCQHFHWLHSLDSLKLANRINRFALESHRQLPVLLECNVSGEESKFGWPAWDEARWSELLPAIGQIAALPGLRVRGLMTMAPFTDDPELTRPYFQRLRSLQHYLASCFPEVGWDELSMGMSQDYEVAIQEGATQVRIGTAIMGPRLSS